MNDSTTHIDNGCRVIPANHIVIGTCGVCGGPVISPMASEISWCMDCLAVPKKKINPAWGPILEMVREPDVKCVGDGTSGSGCGYAGNRGGTGGVCPTCGGMLLSDRALAEAEELIRKWAEWK